METLYRIVRSDSDAGRAIRLALDPTTLAPLSPRSALEAIGPPRATLADAVPGAVGRGASTAWAIHQWIAWVAGFRSDAHGAQTAVGEWLGISRAAWSVELARGALGRGIGVQVVPLLGRLGLAEVRNPLATEDGPPWRSIVVPCSLLERGEALAAAVRSVAPAGRPADADDRTLEEVQAELRGPDVAASALADQRAQVEQLVAAGVSGQQIAIRLGLPRMTLWHRMKRWGLLPGEPAPDAEARS